VYAFFVIALTIGAYMLQKDIEPQNIYTFTKLPKIFFTLVCISLGGMIIGLCMISVSQPAQEWLVGSYLDTRSISEAYGNYSMQAFRQGIDYRATFYLS
jgi:hypothetical protein